jgi:hypothetical protein
MQRGHTVHSPQMVQVVADVSAPACTKPLSTGLVSPGDRRQHTGQDGKYSRTVPTILSATQPRATLAPGTLPLCSTSTRHPLPPAQHWHAHAKRLATSRWQNTVTSLQDILVWLQMDDDTLPVKAYASPNITMQDQQQHGPSTRVHNSHSPVPVQPSYPRFCKRAAQHTRGPRQAPVGMSSSEHVSSSGKAALSINLQKRHAKTAVFPMNFLSCALLSERVQTSRQRRLPCGAGLSLVHLRCHAQYLIESPKCSKCRHSALLQRGMRCLILPR